ncbi:hypothetical protein KI387_034971, partial [Taxus chinensis]
NLHCMGVRKILLNSPKRPINMVAIQGTMEANRLKMKRLTVYLNFPMKDPFYVALRIIKSREVASLMILISA